ncbi:MAG: nickel pincer cofactor biosynthesis protein LarB [Candidatus Marinimicrobia bacterium]|nr:nickel pincer cofactor biosynthesis protein LarB [Candidatus Neomarinimicrobiota bacterium]MCF7880474.1 nickel pincer cofactor biosynthesis protein LarB [Candidatus Neomarinimicrobiota bacterium]
MNEQEMQQLLQLVASGDLPIDEALSQLKSGPFKLAKDAENTVDHHRLLRHGLSEVIYGESKTSDQIRTIAEELAEAKKPVLITRLDEEKLADLSKVFPEARVNPSARTLLLFPPDLKSPENHPYIAIVSAGTSDRPMVEEAAEVCRASEVAFTKIHDVGIAGIHRLYNHLNTLNEASAIIVVAGMEGALPGVVAGMVGKPIFAVPTSVGYGTNLNGFAALFTMLNSCASGVAVVNIDSGFSAAYSACKVIREVETVAKQTTDTTG